MNSMPDGRRKAFRLDPWVYAVALICTGALLTIDIYLYRSGLSWTPLHYESLAPALVIGAHGRRQPLISALAAALLFGTIAVLFFAFGLTFRLAAESWLFLGCTILVPLTWLLPVLIQAWQRRWLPIGFVAVAMGMLVADKVFSHDMLASAYLPHFFKWGTESKPSPSNNAVYAELKQQLAPGRGGVLVVFEALGVPKDKSAVQTLAQDFPDFDVHTLPFEGGSTVPAEIRYLCGVNGTITDFSPCLPRLLPSHAMHGNSLSYFSRQILYRNMGFAELAGKHELADLATCRYSYSAVCDAALWDKLLSDIRASQCRDFHYVLTIDAHFPYVKYTRHVDGLYADLRELMQRLRSISSEFPGCHIVIAGDHPPPLAQGFEARQVLVVEARH